jgi:hypothetical protein
MASSKRNDLDVFQTGYLKYSIHLPRRQGNIKKVKKELIGAYIIMTK